MMGRVRKSLLLIFSFYIFATPASFAQYTQQQIQKAIDRQDRVIRQEQELEEQEKRRKEFEKIEKEREQLKKQKKDQEKAAIPVKSKKCFTIKTIEIIGSDSLSKKQKKKIKAPFFGQCFNSSTLSGLIQKTNLLYQDLGYVTAQVSIPQQNINSGNLRIEVVEGRIEEIILNDNKFSDKMQKFTAFGFMKGKKLDIDDVNQGIYQINRLNSNQAVMKIEPGTEVGYSKIAVNNEKKFPVSAKINYDNLGSEFTGIRKTAISSTIDNILSLNDKIDLSYSLNLDDPSKEKDLTAFYGAISIPFAYNTFSYIQNRSKYNSRISGSSSPLSLSGYSNSHEIAIDRTLLNNTEYRVSTNLSLVTKENASYLNDTKIETSERDLTIGNLSFAVSKYFKNGANLYLKPEYSRGLRILGAKEDVPNSAADIPKAQFQLYQLYASLSKSFQIPKLDAAIFLATEMNGQISRDTLFGSEQFSIGGYYSVRGFRENNISGDHGYYFRNKASINVGQFLAPALKSVNNNFVSKNLHHLHKIAIEPFYDYGYVKTKYNSDSGRLSGAGLKTKFFSKYFDASLTYSWALQKSNLISSSDKENKMLYFELSAKCC